MSASSPEFGEGGSEFWQEQKKSDRADMRKHFVRWGLIMGGLLVAMSIALWWSGSAVTFSSARVNGTAGATYQVRGMVRDARTGRAIPWAEIADDPAGRPTQFRTVADRNGVYELMTIAEPHTILCRALGYAGGQARVGKTWYLWTPSGAERVDIDLQPE